MKLRLLVVAMVALAACLTACSAESDPRPVIVDTDMGFDDVRALLLLLESDEVEVVAVTVAGNGLARCPRGGSNAKAILDLYGLSDVPVACGSAGPVAGFNLAPTQWRDGSDELAGMGLATDLDVAENAPELIVETLGAAENPITILTLGPLTNLARALTIDPTIGANIDGVHVMGGAVDVGGNILDFEEPVAEFNIWFDPVAARQVFTAGLDLTLVPLDATNGVPLTPYFYDVFASERPGPAGALLTGYTAANPFMGGVYHWDDLAAATLLDESLVEFENRVIDVVVEGNDQGWTVASADGVAMRVAVSVEADAFEDLFYEALAGAADPGVAAWEPDARVTFDGENCTYSGPDPLPSHLELLAENTSNVSALGVLVVEYDEGTTMQQVEEFNASNPSVPPPFFTIYGVAPLSHSTASVWSYRPSADATLLCVVTMTESFELAGVRIGS